MSESPPELHKKAALAAAEQKITLNQYVMKAIDQSFENPNVKEIRIFIPYSTQKVDWDVESVGDFLPWYEDGTVLTQKENVSYDGN